MLADLPVERLREIQPTFDILTDLLGPEEKARKALIEENIFVTANKCNLGIEFARRVRSYLVENGLEWNQENLLTAVRNAEEEK